jgi:hypothetical protein
MYLYSFFLDPEDIGAIWNCNEEQGSIELITDFGAQRALFKA